MANFTALKTAINNAIKTNGNEEITGAILQAILDAMVETLGDSAINDLENAITTEVTNRENAVGGVADDLAAEALARANKDNQLDGRINQEEYNRANADAALSRIVDQGFQTLNSQMTALNAAISALNAAYQNGFLYGGIATPSSSPSNNKCFYIALQGGTYTNFGGVGVVEGINIIKNDSGWKVEHIYDQTTLLNEFYLLRQQVIRAISSIDPIVIQGDVTNAPDEEDLTSDAQHLLKFKDRAYSPLNFSGLGMKILRKNIAPLSDSAVFNGFVEGVTAEETLLGTPEYIFWDRMNTRFVGIKDGVYYLDWTDSDNYVPVSTSLVYMYNGTPYQWTGSDFSVDETEVPNLVNCLTQDMINEANTIYIIRYDYTLKENITIPANCVLQFDGGSISGNNTLTLNNAIVNGNGLLCNLSGKTRNTITPRTCGAIGDGITDDSIPFVKAATYGKGLVVDGVYKLAQQISLPEYTSITGIGKGTSVLITNGIKLTNYCTVNNLTFKPLNANTSYILLFDNEYSSDNQLDTNISNVLFIGQPYSEKNSSTVMIKILIDSNPSNGQTGFCGLNITNIFQEGIFLYGLECECHYSTNVPSYHPWVTSCYFANWFLSWVRKTIFIHNTFADGVSITPETNNFSASFENIISQFRASDTTFGTEHFIYLENAYCKFDYCGCSDMPTSMPAVYCNNDKISISYLNDIQNHQNYFMRIIGVTDCSLKNLINQYVLAYSSAAYGDQIDYLVGNRVLYNGDDYAAGAKAYFPLGQINFIDEVQEAGRPTNLIGLKIYSLLGKKIYAIGQQTDGSPCVSVFDQENKIHKLKYIYSDAYMPKGAKTEIPSRNVVGAIFYRSDLATNYRGLPTWCYLEGDNNQARYADAFGFHPNVKYGSTSQRPSTANGNSITEGSTYIDQTIHKPLWWFDKWIEYDGAAAGVKRSGVSTDRPSGTSIYIGFMYFDTTLNKPIYASAINENAVTWVDATGATV